MIVFNILYIFLLVLLLTYIFNKISKYTILDISITLIVSLILNYLITYNSFIDNLVHISMYSLITFSIISLIKKYKITTGLKFIYVLSIIFVLELTVFNFRHYETLFNKPESINFNTINEADSTLVKTVEFNKKINNFYLDLSFPTASTKVNIYARDDGNKIFTYMGKISYFEFIEESKYNFVAFAGKTKEIKLKFDTSYVQVNKIVINSKRPLLISTPRILVLLLITVLVFLFNPKSKLYKIKMSKNLLFILPIILVEVEIIYIVSAIYPHELILDQYNSLTTALLNKRLYLNENNNKVLESMDNPYDYSYRQALVKHDLNNYYDSFNTRSDLELTVDKYYKNNNLEDNTNNNNFPWDQSYYNNKYYVYFGIGPVLTTYLPYRLITHKTIDNYKLITFILVITSISAIFFIYKLCKKFFKDISLGLFYLIAFVFVNGIGIFGILSESTFYMIPILYSLFFVINGLNIIINIYDSKKNYYWLYFLAGFLLSFTSLCRPQALLSTLLVIPFLINRLKNKDITKDVKVKEAIMFILPYMINGIICCTYNYLRFDSIFEFGASYQLTINDVLHKAPALNKILPSIEYYLLMPPRIIGTYPFLEYINFDSSYIGYMYVEYMYGGLFLTHVVLLSNLLLFKYKDKINKTLYQFSIISILLGVFIAIFDGIEGGLVYRYFYDFHYLFYIPACIVLFTIFKNIDKKDFNKYLKILIVLIVLTLLFMLFQQLSGTGNLSRYGKSNIVYYTFKYLFK